LRHIHRKLWDIASNVHPAHCATVLVVQHVTVHYHPPSKVPGKESNLTFVIAAGITNGVVELALLLIAASSRTDNEHVIKMDVKVVEIQPGKRPFMDLIVRDITKPRVWIPCPIVDTVYRDGEASPVRRRDVCAPDGFSRKSAGRGWGTSKSRQTACHPSARSIVAGRDPGDPAVVPPDFGVGTEGALDREVRAGGSGQAKVGSVP